MTLPAVEGHLLIERLSHAVASDSSFRYEPVETWVELSTGRIYNPTRMKEDTKAYYSNSYDLQGQDDALEFQMYSDDAVDGIHARLVEFVGQGAPELQRPRILDVGCGKGLLLKALSHRYPDSELRGVEPSAVAVSRAGRIVPDVEIWQGTLEDSPYVNDLKGFDLLLAHGVLEHVPEPDTFLQLLAGLLDDDGYLFIGVPNFRNNVADLLTIDHITRFTPDYFRQLVAKAGLKINSELVSDSAIPMWFLLSHGPSLDVPEVRDEAGPWDSVAIAMRNASLLDWQLRQLDYARQLSQLSASPLNLFGTGTLALFGLHEAARVGRPNMRVFDDNESLWGSEFLGCEVQGLSAVEKSLSPIFYMNANPCYHDRMRGRIRQDVGDSALVLPYPYGTTG